MVFEAWNIETKDFETKDFIYCIETKNIETYDYFL